MLTEIPLTKTPTFSLNSPLQVQSESSWRSLGGRLDYSGWSDRMRFLELDYAIASSAVTHPDQTFVFTFPVREYSIADILY